MRALWRQRTRPRLQITSGTSSEAVGGVLARRTTTAPLRRRKTFKDAFTVFLVPVLATAFVADLNWKEKQKRDWDSKIAEIQAEIELIHAREIQAWSSIQMRSISHGAAHQRRCYSTAAAPVLQPDDERGMEEDHRVPTNEPMLMPQIMTEEDVETPVYRKELEALRIFERLIAVKLAIQMILHVHIGNDPRFAHLTSSYHHEPNNLPQDINGLVERLRVVRQDLNALKVPLHALSSSRRLNSSPERKTLDNNLMLIADQCRNRRITVAEAVEAFAFRILESGDAPTIATYTKFLHMFGRDEHEGLAYLFISAMGATKLPLDNEALWHILLTLGKSKDTHQLDKFLKDVTQLNGHFNVEHKWDWWKVGGVRIPVPGDQNPRIVQLMVFLALRSHQLDRAEAWASVIRDQQLHGKVKVELCKNFLNYYAAHSDWERGRAWINVASRSATSVAKVGMHNLQRMIFRMLDLCVACGRPGEYSQILEVAVESGIPPETPDTSRPVNVFVRGQRIIDEWAQLYQHSAGRPDSTDEQKASHFQELISTSKTFSEVVHVIRREDLHNQLTDTNSDAAGSSVQPTATVQSLDSWKQTHEEQRATVVNLQKELDLLKAREVQKEASTAGLVAAGTLSHSHLEKLRDEVGQSRSELASIQAARELHDHRLTKMREQMEQLQKEMLEQTQRQREQHKAELEALRDEIEASRNMMRMEREKESEAQKSSSGYLAMAKITRVDDKRQYTRKDLALERHLRKPPTFTFKRFELDPSHDTSGMEMLLSAQRTELEGQTRRTKTRLGKRSRPPVPLSRNDGRVTTLAADDDFFSLSAAPNPDFASISTTPRGNTNSTQNGTATTQPPQPNQDLVFTKSIFKPFTTSPSDESGFVTSFDDLISDLTDLTRAPESERSNDIDSSSQEEPWSLFSSSSSPYPSRNNPLPLLPPRLLRHHGQHGLRIANNGSPRPKKGGELTKPPADGSDWIHHRPMRSNRSDSECVYITKRISVDT